MRIWEGSKGLGLFLVALGMALGMAFAGAQEVNPGPAGVRDRPPIRLEVQVSTRGEEPVLGLGAGDFTLLDNGKPRAIDSVREVDGKTAAVEVVVVLDGENASQELIRLERERMGTFLLENGGRLRYPTSVAVMSTRGMQMVRPTLDGKGLNDAMQRATIEVRALDMAKGGVVAQQRVSDSLRGLQQLLLKLRGEPGRKLVVFLSPGWPLIADAAVVAMGKLPEQIFASVTNTSLLLREAEVTLYNVAPYDPGENIGYAGYYQGFMKGVVSAKHVEPGDVGLQVLAMQSGGRVDELNDGKTDFVERDVRDADHYYEVTFAPAEGVATPEYHQLQVKVSGDAVARTRMSYYTGVGVP